MIFSSTLHNAQLYLIHETVSTYLHKLHMYWFLKYNYELRANDEEKIYVITPISISTEDIAVVYNGVRSGCLLTKSCTIYNC